MCSYTYFHEFSGDDLDIPFDSLEFLWRKYLECSRGLLSCWMNNEII